jgi:pimeloyl-ACP methyl ester carboxylesterase
VARARWPEPEPVPDWSQGVPLTILTELCKYWHDEYDWRTTGQRRNRIPQFRTTIDDLPIYFLHVRSRHTDATPLVLTHGWPGSFLEFELALPLLTDPPDGEPAFHVVAASLPGYAFSGRPTTTGWDIHHIARAWCELMTRLDYPRFLAAGSDWGTSISTSIALQLPNRLIGLHLVTPLVPPATQRPDRRRTRIAGRPRRTHPHRVGILGHTRHPTPDRRVQPVRLTRRPCCLDRREAVDLGRSERGRPKPQPDAGQPQPLLAHRHGRVLGPAVLGSIAGVSEWFTSATVDTISVPTGCSIFPKEVPRPSRRWAARRFTNIVHWNQPDRGGHFGAWEQPELSARDLRVTIAANRMD